MAIKVNGTTVIDDSANVTTSLGGFKTVGGSDITGSGNITTGAGTGVNDVGTYTLAYDTGMGDNSTFAVYKEGRTAAGSALRPRAALASSQDGADRTATSTSGTSATNGVVNNVGYNSPGTVISNQTYSGSWRLMSPGANRGQGSNGWNQLYTGLWVRYS